MAIIAPLPINLQNGTTADANQVMSNFNAIRNNVNANAQDAATAAKINVTNTFTAPQIVPDAVALNEVPNAAQIEQNEFKYVVDSGAADAYVVAPSIAWAAYVAGADLFVTIDGGNSNTGASTIAVSALAAKAILNEDLSALSPNSLLENCTYHIVYDGTRFILVGTNKLQTEGAAIASAATIDLETSTGGTLHVTGNTGPVTAVTLAQGHRRTVVFESTPTLTHSSSLILRNGISRAVVAGETVEFFGEGGGVTREISTPTTKQPTFQIFTTGSGTYTTPAGAIRLAIRMIGGGGGGGGAPTNTGVTGGNTTFDTFTASGGVGGTGAVVGGVGGAASGGTVNIPGGRGAPAGLSGTSGVASGGGNGGSSAFGGGGGGGPVGVTTGTGQAGSTNSGGGGGGGGAANAQNAGSGGGSGGYVEGNIASPAATYSYAVGAGGAGGVGAANTGGAGAAGIIIVQEFYS